MGSRKVSGESQKPRQNAVFLFKLFRGRYDYLAENMPLSLEQLKEGLSYRCKRPKFSKMPSPSRGNVWPGNSIVMLLSTELGFFLNSLLRFTL